MAAVCWGYCFVSAIIPFFLPHPYYAGTTERTARNTTSPRFNCLEINDTVHKTEAVKNIHSFYFYFYLERQF